MHTQDIDFANFQKNQSEVEVGESSVYSSHKIRIWNGATIDGNNNKILRICLKKTLHIPGLTNNLFSIIAAMTVGARLCNHKNGIRVELPLRLEFIYFCKKIKTKNCFVLASVL